MSFTNAMKLFTKNNNNTPIGLKVVRVIKDCAYITDGVNLIRRGIQGVPDGFYDVEPGGALVPVKNKSYGLGTAIPYNEGYSKSRFMDELFYLDVSVYEPNWSATQSLTALPATKIREMMQLCLRCREVEGTMAIAKDGLFIVQNQNWSVLHGFNVRYPMRVDSDVLLVLLTECIAHLGEGGVVYLLQEYKPEHEDAPRTPLIIGKDRNTYCLLKPEHKGRYYNG